MKTNSRRLPEYVPCDVTAGGITPFNTEAKSAEHNR